MSSHIHELWNDLGLPEEYPELDPEAILSRVEAALEQEEAASAPPEGPRQNSMKKKMKWAVLLAATLALTMGAALAAAYQMGVLDLFFTRGDASVVEPYVQDTIKSVENEDYRLTADSMLYDGQNVFVVLTVEGLNQQAIDDLMSNRAFAEAHRDFWGEDMVSRLLESGSTGPDGISYDLRTHSGSMGIHDLPNPSGTSRSWQIDIQFGEYVGPLEEPLNVWLAFMGRDYAVRLPMDSVVEPIRVTPDLEVISNEFLGLRGRLKELILTPVSYSYELERLGDWSSYADSITDLGVATDLFYLKMKDGSILTLAQLGDVNHQFEQVVDLTQVDSIVFDQWEFPVDGSPTREAELDPRLRPFLMDPPSPVYDLEGLRLGHLSLRQLCERLGAEYRWDEDSQTATARYRGVTITATAGSSTILVDGQPIEATYYSTKTDENGDEMYLPNPAVPVPDGCDLLVGHHLLEDAWNIWCLGCWSHDVSPEGFQFDAWLIIP